MLLNRRLYSAANRCALAGASHTQALNRSAIASCFSRAARVSATLVTREPSGPSSVMVTTRWLALASARRTALALSVPHSEVRATVHVDELARSAHSPVAAAY